MILSRGIGLRAIEREDLPQLRDWRNIAAMRRFFRENRELNMLDQEQWLQRLQSSATNQMFAIVRQEDGALAGACGLTNINWVVRSAEISLYIGLNAAYIEATLAPDAVLALLRHGFLTLGMHKIWAEVYAFDTQKIGLLVDRFGFRRDGVLRAAVFEDGAHHDSLVLSMLRHEFDAMPPLEEARPAAIDWHYYSRQFDTPFRSTVHACEFLESCNAFRPDTLVLDMGAGSGAVIAYLAQRHPNTRFLGIDAESEVVAFGQRKLAELGLANASLIHGDLFSTMAGQFGPVDGIFSSHFLLLFEEFATPLERMLALSPRWIAANSLFFEGRVQSVTTRYDYNDPTGGMPYRKATYSTFSLPLVREFLAGRGYSRFASMPFAIDVDLPHTGQDLGTYTVRTETGARLQFSGPMHMPWQFVFAAQED